MSHEHTDTQQTTETDTDAQTTTTDGRQNEIVVETQPTLKPTSIAIAAVVLLGSIVIAYLYANPTLLGSVDRTEIALNLTAILMVVALVRLLLRLYVLTRTRYVLTTDAVRREYSLLYKSFSRELPLAKVRSHELRRNRTETLLGIGSVSFLTGSVAQSPAHLRFRNVPDPERIRAQVRNILSDDEIQ
ncbi:PH domain-containing protein [Haloarcula salina]|uniref:PH domain-containing protein n=1 Tax=Haloarcula salina TaxID=1429914 RepID=UPI003C6FF90A